MKKAVLLSALLFGASLYPTFSQSVGTQKMELVRKIDVSGHAEKEVVPDEIYFNVSLREYFKDDKNQKDKVGISTLEKQLMNAVAEAGLPKEALSISGVGGYQNYVDKKKKPSTFLEAKQYELKVTSPEKLDAILAKVDSRGVQYANVNRVDYSKREELKKQVKIDALKAAKEKAAYLVAAVDQKLGQILEIRELDENIQYPQPMYKMANVRAMAVAESADAIPDSEVQYQKIKIEYRMQASFEIK